MIIAFVSLFAYVWSIILEKYAFFGLPFHGRSLQLLRVIEHLSLLILCITIVYIIVNDKHSVENVDAHQHANSLSRNELIMGAMFAFVIFVLILAQYNSLFAIATSIIFAGLAVVLASTIKNNPEN